MPPSERPDRLRIGRYRARPVAGRCAGIAGAATHGIGRDEVVADPPVGPATEASSDAATADPVVAGSGTSVAVMACVGGAGRVTERVGFAGWAATVPARVRRPRVATAYLLGEPPARRLLAAALGCLLLAGCASPSNPYRRPLRRPSEGPLPLLTLPPEQRAPGERSAAAGSADRRRKRRGKTYDDAVAGPGRCQAGTAPTISPDGIYKPATVSVALEVGERCAASCTPTSSATPR